MIHSKSFTYELCSPANISRNQPDFINEVWRMRTLLQNGALELLEPIDCINTYNVKYQSKFGSVFLVSDSVTAMFYDTCHWPQQCIDYNCPVEDCNNYGPSYCPVRNQCQPTFNPGWMCNTGPWGYSVEMTEFSSCTLFPEKLRNNASNWRLNTYGRLDSTITTAYCLAEKIDGRCYVQNSPHVAVIVLALNLAKGIVMLVVSRRASNRALITFVMEYPLS
jgi:hypothetical protein